MPRVLCFSTGAVSVGKQQHIVWAVRGALILGVWIGGYFIGVRGACANAAPEVANATPRADSVRAAGGAQGAAVLRNSSGAPGALGSASSARPDSSARSPRASEAEREQIKRVLSDIGRRQVEGGKYRWERQKQPRVALFSSALLPGLGQVYNGRRLKVAIMVGVMSFYAGSAIQDWRHHKYYRARARRLPEFSNAQRNADAFADSYEKSAIDFLWWSGGTWLLGMIDAWIDAHLYDVRGYTPVVPDVPAAGDTPRLRIGSSSSHGTRYVIFGIGLK